MGVSAQGNAVLIEATEPVAYAVSRPDPLTLLVDLRNVNVADAANVLERRDPIAGVTLEQATPSTARRSRACGSSLARPYEYRVRSARNTIRLELDARNAAGAQPARSQERSTPAPQTAGTVPVATDDVPPATILDHVRASRTRVGDDGHARRQRPADARRR